MSRFYSYERYRRITEKFYDNWIHHLADPKILREGMRNICDQLLYYFDLVDFEPKFFVPKFISKIMLRKTIFDRKILTKNI